MKIKSLVTAALLLVLMTALAGAEVRNIRATFSGVDSVVTPVTVNGTANVTSQYMDLSWGRDYAVQWRCISADASPSVTLEWLAGSVASSSHMMTTNMSAIASSHSGETWSAVTSLKQGTIEPPRVPFGAIKITGQTGNQSDTACSVIFLLGD